MLLVDIGNLHRLPYLYISHVGLLQTHDKAEESRLSGAVRADYTHYAGGRQAEGQILEEKFVAVSLAHAVEFDDLVAKAGAVGNVYLQILFLLLGIGGSQFLVCAQTSLALGVACLGSHPGPLQLVLQSLAALAFLLLFHRQAPGLLLQPRRIVPLPGDALTTVEFQYPAGDVVKEVTVVRDSDDRALVLLQMGL